MDSPQLNEKLWNGTMVETHWERERVGKYRGRCRISSSWREKERWDPPPPLFFSTLRQIHKFIKVSRFDPIGSVALELSPGDFWNRYFNRLLGHLELLFTFQSPHLHSVNDQLWCNIVAVNQRGSRYDCWSIIRLETKSRRILQPKLTVKYDRT